MDLGPRSDCSSGSTLFVGDASITFQQTTKQTTFVVICPLKLKHYSANHNHFFGEKVQHFNHVICRPADICLLRLLHLFYHGSNHYEP